MQETGKTNISCGKILSTQSQLGGLSFYCSDSCKYSFRQTADVTEYASAINKEIAGENYDAINFFHHEDRYIIIPRELFDENMCDAYLQTKGFTVNEGEEIIIFTSHYFVFISLFDSATFELLDSSVSFVNVAPIISKPIAYGMGYDNDILSYVLIDNRIHIAYCENKILKFCESLPVTSCGDIEFYFDKITKMHKSTTTLKVVSLYETGEVETSQNLISKYNILKLTTDNYFAI